MSAHHVDLPEQVVTPGEELWVKIIDLDLQRRRISLSIKQAAEGGIVAAEYQEHFGEHAYDDQGNYIGPTVEHSPEADEAWAEYYAEGGEAPAPPAGTPGGEAPAPPADGGEASAAPAPAGEAPSADAGESGEAAPVEATAPAEAPAAEAGSEDDATE
jgi:small subunit ribosomal protein S1